MRTVTISPKFQVVIPLEVRQKMSLEPGQKVQVINYNNRIEIIPVKNIKQMRGFLGKINTVIGREEANRV